MMLCRYNISRAVVLLEISFFWANPIWVRFSFEVNVVSVSLRRASESCHFKELAISPKF